MNDFLIRGRSEKIDLPSVLNGAGTAAEWLFRRRPEILALLENQVYGALPPRPREIVYELEREVSGVFDGLGIRREIAIHLRHSHGEHTAHALWYLPANIPAGIPLICALNFQGNAACTDEPDVFARPGEIRGKQASRWQIPFLLKNGFSLITAPREDFFPDDRAARPQSIFRLFHPASELTEEARQYTAISAWAWGCSRLLELGQTEERIDPRRIWVHGHSRLGKTALWCAANDTRFAGAVANCSGCCGDSLLRDRTPDAEHVAQITGAFPHWFQQALDGFAGRENELPFDQHFLAALLAPRPLLVAAASCDFWADPYNAFRSMKNISCVYRLFGTDGLPDDTTFPSVDSPVFGGRAGYYLRDGEHDVTATDWRFVLDFIRRF